MKNIIHIYGASGSGTSTLGRKISEELGCKFMDTDISENDNVVISGSLVDWGDELIPLFTLEIRSSSSGQENMTLVV